MMNPFKKRYKVHATYVVDGVEAKVIGLDPRACSYSFRWSAKRFAKMSQARNRRRNSTLMWVVTEIATGEFVYAV